MRIYLCPMSKSRCRIYTRKSYSSNTALLDFRNNSELTYESLSSFDDLKKAYQSVSDNDF